MFDKKYRIPIIITFITFILFFGGLSFAYFFVTKETNTKNIISIGDFNIEYKSGNGINLTNTYPMPDGYGQKTKGHEVTITNNSKTNACYEIMLIDKYTDASETYQGNSTLTRNQLKYSINMLTAHNVPNINEVLYTGILDKEETKNINFRLWIDETETIETSASKTYFGKLIINTVNCEIPQVSTTKGAPIITSDTNYVKTQTIKVINDATFENGNVASYEYVIKPTNTEPTESDIPIKITGSSIQITEEQTGFISFRGISTHEEASPWSNRIEIKVDITPPKITVQNETDTKEYFKTVIINFNDEKSGISHYQVTNENVEPFNWIEITNASETSATFTATKNGTYYVWAKDKAGNISNSVPFTIKNVFKVVVDIVDNMIPITWEKDKWVKTDISNFNNGWYDYKNQKWANSVLVTNESRAQYKSSPLGTEVLEKDILAYYVYIPRYRYQLWNTNYSTNCLNDNCAEQEIKIEIETKDDQRSLGSYNGEWLTHPAFTFGDTELNGIWVGKFTTTVDQESLCYAVPNTSDCNNPYLNPEIKPNVDMWRNAQVATMFRASKRIEDYYIYGLSEYENIDSHLMKNMEWGAVAFFSHSKYGKYGNDDYSGANKQLYINNYSTGYDMGYRKVTGCSSGQPAAIPTSSGCPHPYPLQTSEALGASTTGNIYGIYDMSGGVWEMGQTVQESYFPIGIFNSNPSSGNWGSTPEQKYYDSYAYDRDNTLSHGRGYLGDATREIVTAFGSYYGSWYYDNLYMPYGTLNWFVRGGVSNHGATAGVFAFGPSDGNADGDTSFRMVLVIEE